MTPDFDDYLGRAKDAYDDGSSYATTLCLIAIAESLARIADALEAMKPQTVEATLEEFDSAGFAQAIAEALKRPGVRSADISAPHDMGGLYRISDGGTGDEH